MTREEAIKGLKVFVGCVKDETFESRRSVTLPIEALDMAIEALKKEPKRGKWVDVSERGSWSIKNACDQCSEIVFQPNYNYCPNCGARMEVEE